ncbi:hypothetical protein CYMTET_51773 [Cymbomonas tetramitiformis]|uniref:Uncharacterized protein n=1 Tax=Cymbomonas tetramitiformis TaxID=36881 RepID=A0AAE0BKD3_9CHLO|nr:hypothetical protein CYMTET_51773 [Cymbomonas tetramitiformis]
MHDLLRSLRWCIADPAIPARFVLIQVMSVIRICFGKEAGAVKASGLLIENATNAVSYEDPDSVLLQSPNNCGCGAANDYGIDIHISD